MSRRSRRSPVWAITSYFTFDDPPKVKRRLAAYRKFRERLQVPLVAVELSRGRGFDLSPTDAEILVQIRGGALLWQKERLLNIALRSLPACCDTVAWIDCDVTLEREDWPEAAREAATGGGIVQLFRQVFFLGRGQAPGEGSSSQQTPVNESLAYRWGEGSLPPDIFATEVISTSFQVAPGLAWAAGRDLLERHGFYDAMILSGGDRAILAAACGQHAAHAQGFYMTSQYAEHYYRWAIPFRKAVAGRIGYLEGNGYHQWHGDLESRNYIGRYENFERFQFDPCVDLVENPDGVWDWGSDNEALHEWAVQWFEGRKRSTI